MKTQEAQYLENNVNETRNLAYAVNNNSMSLSDLQDGFNPFEIRYTPAAPNSKRMTESVITLFNDETHEKWSKLTGVRDFPTVTELRDGWNAPSIKAKATNPQSEMVDEPKLVEALDSDKVTGATKATAKAEKK